MALTYPSLRCESHLYYDAVSSHNVVEDALSAPHTEVRLRERRLGPKTTVSRQISHQLPDDSIESTQIFFTILNVPKLPN